jgi:uncharacterized protein DUF955
MIVDDCKVRFHWSEEVENIGEQTRKGLLGSADPAEPILSLLNEFSARIPGGLEILTLPDAAMGRAKAFVSNGGRRLNIGWTLHQRAAADEPDARFDIGHEIGHVVLHPGQIPLARMVDGNIKQVKLRQEESSEHQANTFARAFLLPSWMIGSSDDASSLALRAKLPLDQVERRLQSLADRRSRETRISLRQARLELPALPARPSVQERASSANRREQEVWNAAPHAPGHDPSEFRLSRGGFLVRRSDKYKRSSELGWIIDGNSIVSSLELRTD